MLRDRYAGAGKQSRRQVWPLRWHFWTLAIFGCELFILQTGKLSLGGGPKGGGTDPSLLFQAAAPPHTHRYSCGHCPGSPCPWAGPWAQSSNPLCAPAGCGPLRPVPSLLPGRGSSGARGRQRSLQPAQGQVRNQAREPRPRAGPALDISQRPSCGQSGTARRRAACPGLRMDPFEDTLRRLREAFSAGLTRPAEFRAEQLRGLGRFLQDNKQLLQDALAQDLHKSAFESELSEIAISQSEVTLALRNLRAWMKDQRAHKNLATQLDSAFIRKEPFGLVLIVAPWNYPLNLTLVPLVGALAAGNCVVLKPSEISTSVEKVLAEVLPRYLDQVSRAGRLGGPSMEGPVGQTCVPTTPQPQFPSEEPVPWGPMSASALPCSPWPGLSPPCSPARPNLAPVGLGLGEQPTPTPLLPTWRPGDSGSGQARGQGPGGQARQPLGSRGWDPRGASACPALQSCFAVVLGGPQEMGQLLEHRFDYIFFTGWEQPWTPGPLRKGRSPTSRATACPPATVS
nr:aldehyde dehydrogenase family 3 member B1 isoform X4 [Microcebus murinus]